MGGLKQRFNSLIIGPGARDEAKPEKSLITPYFIAEGEVT
jgi:hypothetical protein